MTTRPNLGPWQTFGNGAQRVQRKPYAEAEILPAAAGGRWSVRRIVPASGSFRLVASGLESQRKEAESKAMDCLLQVR